MSEQVLVKTPLEGDYLVVFNEKGDKSLCVFWKNSLVFIGDKIEHPKH